MRRVFWAASLVIALLVGGLCQPASANTLNSLIVNSGLNLFEDNDREAFVDVNRNGLFDAGDVLIGFVRIEQRTTPPPAVTADNEIYAIFSQQVSPASNGTNIIFQPTTVVGLRLSDIVPGAPANAVVAVYDADTAYGSTDLTTTSPGDRTGNGTVTLADYFNFIQQGNLEIIGSLVAPTDFFAAVSIFPIGTLTTAQIQASTTTVANFTAGLTITTNNTGHTLTDSVLNTTPPGFVPLISDVYSLAVTGGNVTGANGAANLALFSNVSEFGSFAQCGAGGTTPCGFITNADFEVFAVPAPATLLILGAGLIGLGFTRSRRR